MVRSIAQSFFLALLFLACRSNPSEAPPEQPRFASPTVFVPLGVLRSPRGIAVDSSGDVWIADTYGNRLTRFAPSGSQKISSPGFISPGRMGNLKSSEEILMVNGGNTVMRIDPRTDAAHIVSFVGGAIDTGSIYDVNLRQQVSRSIRINQLGDLDGSYLGDIYISGLTSGGEHVLLQIRSGGVAAVAVSASSQSGTVAPPFVTVDDFGVVFSAFARENGIVQAYAYQPSNLSNSHFLFDSPDLSLTGGGGMDRRGFLFVADTRTNEIIMFSSSSERIVDFITLPAIAGITQPVVSDVAVGPDGSLYAAVIDQFDTSNERGVVLFYKRRSNSQ